MRRWISSGLILFLSALVLVTTLPAPAAAQAKYPSRPIQLICPWAAGGGTDRIARMVAVLLEKELGQPVTVVNRTGGSGAVGHTAGATAAPDGYTITIVTVELAMMHWMGLTPLTYREFTPAVLLNIDPAGVQVAATSEWKTLKQLLDYVKANPGKPKASGTGKGGIWDLARAGMLKTAGIPIDAMPWVPSTGAATGLQELVAGGVQVVTASLVEGRPLIDAGKVRPLAHMADKRDPAFPDVPTLKEQGINWTMGAWRGIALPKGTPPEIVAVMEKALDKVVKSKEFVDFMNKGPFGILYKPAAEFGKFLAEQDETMGVLMKEAGLTR
ncbi:MAG: tripartite tricarboxylate transporter substrate binding protein [candidate division NC10 bacterium]|nr:tripartite tricarboxylate transporter substrate binding protein [candidate division NC10 bacterium]MBI2113759.1 tripartite tricarboxylate transporter substrate binding protein [candidate division NC10 bacterium]MBI2563165.1 tripartite tricarboxylate transporter substrate binding protein [candidate division NC10 bacterium]